MADKPWSSEEFEQRLRAFAPKYHINHPFQKMMHEGELNREQIQGWVLNRFYYQVRIPIKDAILLSKIDDRDTRRSGFSALSIMMAGKGAKAVSRPGLALARQPD